MTILFVGTCVDERETCWTVKIVLRESRSGKGYELKFIPQKVADRLRE